MLPQIAHSKSAASGRRRWGIVICGMAVLALPTWTQPVRSQSVDAKPKPKANQSLEKKPALAGKSLPSIADQTPSDKLPTNMSAVVRPALLPTAPPSVEYFPQPIGEEKRILAVLEEQVDINFEKETLEGVLAKLSGQHNIQFEIDKYQLEERSIKSDSADMTLKLSGISLNSGLKILLKQKGLGFFIEDAVLRVTTQRELLKVRPTRTYPVRDLVDDVDVDYQLLSKTIRQTIGGQPEAPWDEENGEGGVTAAMPATGSLVIRQTYEAHEQILELLRSLRQANKEVTELKVK